MIDWNAELCRLLVKEGGDQFTDRPADAGGPTKFGITAETLGHYRKEGRAATASEVAALTKSDALALYRSEFVVKPGWDLVATLSEKVAVELLDTGVNMGVGAAGDFFQRLLNVFNRRGSDYPDVVVDGKVGPATREAFRRYLRARGPQAEAVMLRALNCLQGAAYVGLAEGRPFDEDNVFGWIAQRVDMAA